MFEAHLLEAAESLRAVFKMPNVHASGWIQRASRVMRMLQKAWGGKCPDEFDQLWNKVVEAVETEESVRKKAVAAAHDWLANHFGIKEEVKESQDGPENIQSGLVGVVTDPATATVAGDAAGLREPVVVGNPAIRASSEIIPSPLAGIQEDPQPADLGTDG